MARVIVNEEVQKATACILIDTILEMEDGSYLVFLPGGMQLIIDDTNMGETLWVLSEEQQKAIDLVEKRPPCHELTTVCKHDTDDDGDCSLCARWE